MPSIDFYTLEPDSPGDRALLTCRLVEKARDTGRRVFICCADSDQARQLDHLLWVYRQESFIPHGLAGHTDPVLTPVIIGTAADAQDACEVLINLAAEVPTWFIRCAQVCEPVDQDEGIRAAARGRFRRYRELGFPPHHHAVRLGRDL
jgi:DNA polymerase III subunit chi